MDFLLSIIQMPLPQIISLIIGLGILKSKYNIDILGFFFNNKKTDNAGLSAQMEDLRIHFNEETTHLLSEIRDGVTKLNNKHDEWERFGIPTRECKKHE